VDYSIGAVKVVNPGTPVSVVAGLGTPPPTRVAAQAIAFQALPTNVGIVYVGGLGMIRSTYVGVRFVIPAPGSPITGPFITATLAVPNVPSGLNVALYYIDANNPGDGVLVTYTNQ
jgi:hypothetical protein